MEGKDIKELLLNVGAGGGAPAVGVASGAGGAAPAAADADAPKEEEKKEDKEESDDDMVRNHVGFAEGDSVLMRRFCRALGFSTNPLSFFYLISSLSEITCIIEISDDCNHHSIRVIYVSVRWMKSFSFAMRIPRIFDFSFLVLNDDIFQTQMLVKAGSRVSTGRGSKYNWGWTKQGLNNTIFPKLVHATQFHHSTCVAESTAKALATVHGPSKVYNKALRRRMNPTNLKLTILYTSCFIATHSSQHVLCRT